ncbi:hypothetical protein HanXRQr2_Chr09g0404801 [Helianthus annuus]|uniref:Uncharacterized protein n=1 Tax=Helianthus annuus TaxID=4232 RepID=A0A9K3I9F0_HELAN|nr:hypothetical protein HanXRQr2_Chr09g0404801 [Helianthus annuus]KAJ0894591.1 hypothetical protein HanPSC8_Chr09g0390741 [Helianthus annuus]
MIKKNLGFCKHIVRLLKQSTCLARFLFSWYSNFIHSTVTIIYNPFLHKTITCKH